MASRLLEGDQIEPVALFLLDHARGFDHALVASSVLLQPVSKATCTPAETPQPLGSNADTHPPAVILPPLSLDLGLLLISIGVVNLWRMRENAS